MTAELDIMSNETPVVMNILKSKNPAAEVARKNDLTVSDVEVWLQDAERHMANGFRSWSLVARCLDGRWATDHTPSLVFLGSCATP